MGGVASYELTAEYLSLVDALYDELNHLEQLNNDIKNDATDDNISKQGWQRKFHSKYERRLTGISTKIILLSASVVEASINLYLLMEIHEIEDYELFNDIERMDLIKKWVVLPRLFNRGYFFDKSGQLYQNLRDLKKNRDAFVHYKPTLKVNDKPVVKGSPHPYPGKTIGEQIEMLFKYADLPRKLVQHLINSGCTSSNLLLLQINLSRSNGKKK